MVVDTSSLAGLSGEAVLQAALPGGTTDAGTDLAAVTNVSPGGTGITEQIDTGTATFTSHSAVNISLDNDNQLSEAAYNINSFGNTFSFDVTFSGPDYLGQNSDTFGSYFDLFFNANVPGDGYVSVLMDNDPFYVTADFTVDSNGNLVTDNSNETTINYVPTPEPAAASLALVALTGMILRRRRSGSIRN